MTTYQQWCTEVERMDARTARELPGEVAARLRAVESGANREREHCVALLSDLNKPPIPKTVKNWFYRPLVRLSIAVHLLRGEYHAAPPPPPPPPPPVSLQQPAPAPSVANSAQDVNGAFREGASPLVSHRGTEPGNMCATGGSGRHRVNSSNSTGDMNMNIDPPPLPYACGLCHKKFQHDAELGRHNRTAHGDRRVLGYDSFATWVAKMKLMLRLRASLSPASKRALPSLLRALAQVPTKRRRCDEAATSTGQSGGAYSVPTITGQSLEPYGGVTLAGQPLGTYRGVTPAYNVPTSAGQPLVSYGEPTSTGQQRGSYNAPTSTELPRGSGDAASRGSHRTDGVVVIEEDEAEDCPGTGIPPPPPPPLAPTSSTTATAGSLVQVPLEVVSPSTGRSNTRYRPHGTPGGERDLRGSTAQQVQASASAPLAGNSPPSAPSARSSRLPTSQSSSSSWATMQHAPAMHSLTDRDVDLSIDRETAASSLGKASISNSPLTAPTIPSAAPLSYVRNGVLHLRGVLIPTTPPHGVSTSPATDGLRAQVPSASTDGSPSSRLPQGAPICGRDNLSSPANGGRDNLSSPANGGRDNLSSPASGGRDNRSSPASGGRDNL